MSTCYRALGVRAKRIIANVLLEKCDKCTSSYCFHRANGIKAEVFINQELQKVGKCREEYEQLYGTDAYRFRQIHH